MTPSVQDTEATTPSTPQDPTGPPMDLLPVATGRRTRAAALELLRPDRLMAVRAGLVLVAATAVGL
ncbi:ABC transporter ATP-binding protein, partial [Streptomyces sp. T-3]|nr:ABC transporter ATP-binding protein [Streptomyces sp. T-3]